MKIKGKVQSRFLRKIGNKRHIVIRQEVGE